MPEGSRSFRLPEYSMSRHMKVARLLALRTGRFYLPGMITKKRFISTGEGSGGIIIQQESSNFFPKLRPHFLNPLQLRIEFSVHCFYTDQNSVRIVPCLPQRWSEWFSFWAFAKENGLELHTMFRRFVPWP